MITTYRQTIPLDTQASRTRTRLTILGSNRRKPRQHFYKEPSRIPIHRTSDIPQNVGMRGSVELSGHPGTFQTPIFLLS